MRPIQLLLGLTLWGLLSHCKSPSEIIKIKKDEQINGVSFVAPPNPIDSSHLVSVKKIGGNWVSLMPYAFLPTNEKILRFATEKQPTQADSMKWQWWGEQPQGVRTCIQLAQKSGLRVLLKPHVWLQKGDFTGHFVCKNEAEWLVFEQSYEQYILQYAQIAEELNVPFFCIGTEWEKFLAARPHFWNQLIEKVRRVYSGKLTYAENWDAYHRTNIWYKLDAIGVDAYFPLSEKANPSEDELKTAWKIPKKGLIEAVNTYKIPVVFTEYGYPSVEYATQKPWENNTQNSTNEELQAKAYLALYESLWQEEWFLGGFLWKWFPIYTEKHQQRDAFSPQGKKVEKVIQTYYKQK